MKKRIIFEVSLKLWGKKVNISIGHDLNSYSVEGREVMGTDGV